MPLVGREGQLRTAELALASAASGEGGVVVLSGEPGIGKTSLLREMGLRAEVQGFASVYGRCLPQHLPYQDLIWQRIWRGLSEKHSYQGTVSAAPAALHPPALEPNGLLSRYPHTEHGQSVAARFDLILDLLERVSGASPLLVCVDDIHYADEASLKLLGFLSHSLDRLPVLFALTYSSFELSSRPEARWLIELIEARGRGVEIGPLDEDATSQLLHYVTGLTPDDRIVRYVRHLTGGNARFTLECGAILGDLNAARPRISSNYEVRIPSAVRVAIKEWLKPLSVEAMKILEVGTVFPQGFDPQLVLEAADLNEADLQAGIAELEGKGLIRFTTHHNYAFTHGFTRELLYREISVARRYYLHCRIATALETHDPHEVKGNARQIAEHLMRSGEPQMIKRAIRYAQFAARHFASVRAFAKAAEMYSTAINAIESQDMLDSGELCGMLIALGETQREAGEVQSAQQSFCRAARLAQDLADMERLVQVALGMPELGWPFADTPNGVALMLAQKSLASQAGGDSSERALLTARVGAEVSYLKGQRQRSEFLFAEAVDLESRLPRRSESIMLRINYLRDHILRRPELVQERLVNADRVIGIARKTGENHALLVSTFAKMCAFFELGNTGLAESELALMEQAATLAGHPAYRVVMLNLRAAWALHQGRLKLAEELCNEARQLGTVNCLGSLADRYWPCLILPLREENRLAELVPVAERTYGAQPGSFADRALLCWLAFELGDMAQAGSHLELLAAEEFADLKQGPYPLSAAALLADVCAGLKNVAYAAALYEFLLPFKNHQVIVEAAFTPFGSVSRYLGKLALAFSNYDQAVAHFEEAFELERRTGGRTWAVYSLLDLAKSLLIRGRPGDSKRAAELGRTAGAEAENLEMHRLAKDIGELSDSDASSGAGLNGGSDLNGRPGCGDCGATYKVPSDAIGRSSPAVASQSCARLRREGRSWELTFQGRTTRLKELRGLTLIAHLLSRPNQSIHTLELASLGKNGEVMAERRSSSDLGPVLDDNAKQAYRARLRELHTDLDQARSSGNEQSGLKIEEELRFLTREIARAVGLFGRDRKTGSDAERARVRATNSIKFAITKIADNQPVLASYLQRTIRTGASCCYIPESSADIAWDL
jgi:tetratricopeptide (TPR) repeat protein